jgi:hypothetical protein
MGLQIFFGLDDEVSVPGAWRGRWSWLSELLRETARAHEMVVHAGQSRIERGFILRTRQGLRTPFAADCPL